MSSAAIKPTLQPESHNPVASDSLVPSLPRVVNEKTEALPAGHQEPGPNSTSPHAPPTDSRPQPQPSSGPGPDSGPAPSEHPPPARRQSLTMFFSDLYKSPKATLSKFRHSQPPEACDYGDPDLLSKDKIKQKAAVRKFLAEKVRNDWAFAWPPPQTASTSANNAAAQAAVPSPEPGVVLEPIVEPAVPTAGDSTAATTTATTSHLSTADATDATPQSPPLEDATVLAGRSPPTITTHAGSQAIPATLPTSDETHPPVGVPDVSVEEETTQQESAPSKCDVSLDDGNESDDDVSSVYSVFSEDETHFRQRLEWSSELSDDESDDNEAPTAFKFESPDTVGETIRAKVLSKKEKRRRAVKEEATWNVGLACFEARRNAWTGAKTVRLKKKPISPAAGFSPRRLFFRSPPATPLSSSPTERKSGDSAAVLSDTSDPHRDAGGSLALDKKQTNKSSTMSIPSVPLPVEVIIPLAPPFLPPSNPMRSSISAAVYPALYDKLVLNGLTPSCPVNLADMIRACVCGWKRDGEWPPRAAMAPPPITIRKKKKKDKATENGSTARRMSLGLLGRDREGGENGGGGGGGGGGGIRRSMQRILGIHHHHPGAA